MKTTPSRRLPPARLACGLLVTALLATSLPATTLANGVSVVDPQTGHRVRLPDNNRDGRADYVPHRLDIRVNPGLTYPDTPRSRQPASSGGSICHGADGGTTVSTARRACDPDAIPQRPARSSSPAAPQRPAYPSTPTRPSSSSSTQLD